MGIKKLLITFMLFTIAALACAQELTVDDMTLEGMDISASTNRRLDGKGTPCALVKVQIASDNVQFEGKVVQPVEFNKGEYWVYMPQGSNLLTIKHPDYAPLKVNFIDYAIDQVQSLSTYLLTVNVPASNKVADDGIRNFRIHETRMAFYEGAKLFIDDQMQKVGAHEAIIPLKKGRHTYRIERPGYVTESGTVDIDKEDVNLTITLKKIKVNVNFTCPTLGANINIQYVSQGKAPWNTDIEIGDYKVEANLEGYRSSSRLIHLTEDSNNKTFELPALVPIEGTIYVGNTPAGAEVYVDGKLMGKTPCEFQHQLKGSHTVEVKRQGYFTEKEEILVFEGLVTQVNGVLQKEGTTDMSVNEMVKLGGECTQSAYEKLNVNREEALELFRKAADLYRKAAELGNPKGQNAWGEVLENGRGAHRNTTEAVKWYRMAAEQGNRDAQFHMGESYELGIFRGLQTDVNQAMSWYKKAAAQGHSGAAERLVILERKHGLYRRR
jgi:hypothetical protein